MIKMVLRQKYRWFRSRVWLQLAQKSSTRNSEVFLNSWLFDSWEMSYPLIQLTCKKALSQILYIKESCNIFLDIREPRSIL